MLTVKAGKTPSYFDKAFGPIFGEGDFRIGKKGEAFSTVGAYTSSYESVGKMETSLQQSFMGGSQDFTLSQYEVYQITFNSPDK